MPQHVLVVDDWPLIRRLARLVLTREGYIVSEAHDGALALERLHASPERLVVLLDCQMPEIDGMQVIEVVAAHDTLITRHAYILVTSVGDMLPFTFTSLLAQLDVPVITKPFDLGHLLHVVSQASARLGSDSLT